MELPKLRLPNLNASGLQTSEKFNLLGDYLLTMERNLRFVLSHLEEDNFSEGLKLTGGGVTSINGQTGDVMLETGGGGGLAEEKDPTVAAWAKQENPPTYTAQDVGLGNVDNVRQYSASNPPPYPVTSVNGKTGSVQIEETDPTVPAWAKASTKPTYSKSDVGLGNVANVLKYSASNPPPYPVTYVNGKTGAVTIETGNTETRKTYTVTVNSSFVSSGTIIAESINGVLMVSGYFGLKKQHAASTTNTICTISGVKVNWNAYTTTSDHDSTSGKAYDILMLTNGNSVTVQMEAHAYALTSGHWVNFTVVGLLG